MISVSVSDPSLFKASHSVMFYTARCGFSFLCSGLLTVCDTLRLLVIYMCCHHRGVDMACHQVLFLVGRADRIELHIV